MGKICGDGSLNERRFEETETGSERRDMEENGARTYSFISITRLEKDTEL